MGKFKATPNLVESPEGCETTHPIMKCKLQFYVNEYFLMTANKNRGPGLPWRETFYYEDICYSNTIILAIIYTYDVTNYELMNIPLVTNSSHLTLSSGVTIADTNLE